MYKTYENIVAITRENCSQLFLLYSGLMRTVGGMRALGFLKKSALDNRNVVMFIDPYKTGFRRGVSEEIPSLDALVNWQREYCKGLPHVKEVYCIGVSAGAFPAIYSGYYLKADAVWTFGARPPAEKYWGQDPEALLFEKATRPIDPNRDPLEECMIDPYIITTVRSLLSTPNGVTQYHLYFAPSNECDTLAHTLISDLPATHSYPIVAPDDYPHNQGPNWDHKLLPIIQHMGGLPELFPPFGAA